MHGVNGKIFAIRSFRFCIFLRNILNIVNYWISGYHKLGGYLLRMLTYPTTLHQNLYISEWKGRGKIGGGLLFEHGFSTIVYCYSLGENCCINQQVTIGVGNGGAPCIGNNVRIYSGAKIFGNITIGDDVIIGANTVVNKDIPSHCVVVGIPGKIVKTRKDYNSLWEKVY